MRESLLSTSIHDLKIGRRIGECLAAQIPVTPQSIAAPISAISSSFE